MAGSERSVQAGPRDAGHGPRRPVHVGRLGDVPAVDAVAAGFGRWADVRYFQQGRRQDARVVGGMVAIYRSMAAELGDALHLSQPVRRIAQDADGVTIGADITVRARRVIVAVPIAIASQIIYEPLLPVDRSFLHQRMPGGAIFKISVIYEEPFWRADGLSGQSAAPRLPRHAEPRRLHRHRPARNHVCPHRRTCRTPARPPRRGRAQSGGRWRSRRPVWSQGRLTRRLPRAELDNRTLLGWRDDQPRSARCSPNSATPCASPVIASIGPELKARRSCAGG